MKSPIHILYATGNGNSRRLAKKLEQELNGEGFDAQKTNLSDLTADQLDEMQFTVWLISTWGEGDPPPDSDPFFQQLASREKPLDHLVYSMVGLGDSCFTHYCGASVTLEEHLLRLGARQAMPSEKLDAFFMPGFREWKGRFLAMLHSKQTTLSIKDQHQTLG
ncbi:MAG: flavodoxin family protein [Verrucomicrobiota bacterium]